MGAYSQASGDSLAFCRLHMTWGTNPLARPCPAALPFWFALAWLVLNVLVGLCCKAKFAACAVRPPKGFFPFLKKKHKQLPPYSTRFFDPFLGFQFEFAPFELAQTDGQGEFPTVFEVCAILHRERLCVPSTQPPLSAIMHLAIAETPCATTRLGLSLLFR